MNHCPDIRHMRSGPALSEAVWVQDQHQEELRLPLQLPGGPQPHVFNYNVACNVADVLGMLSRSYSMQGIWTYIALKIPLHILMRKLINRIMLREWLTTSAPTLDQKTAPPGAQLRYDRQPYDEVDNVEDLKHLDNPCNPLTTTLPRWTRPARWWGTRGRTARRAALAPTSSATRASSSTSRASASTEPKLQESSAELVTPAQNSQIKL